MFGNRVSEDVSGPSWVRAQCLGSLGKEQTGVWGRGKACDDGDGGLRGAATSQGTPAASRSRQRQGGPSPVAWNGAALLRTPGLQTLTHCSLLLSPVRHVPAAPGCSCRAVLSRGALSGAILASTFPLASISVWWRQPHSWWGHVCPVSQERLDADGLHSLAQPVSHRGTRASGTGSLKLPCPLPPCPHPSPQRKPGRKRGQRTQATPVPRQPVWVTAVGSVHAKPPAFLCQGQGQGPTYPTVGVECV